MSEKNDKFAAPQGNTEVGYSNPPDEYKFKPGESGNPNGPPKHRVNLWLWVCKYSSMMDKEIAKLEKSELTQAQQSALKLIQDMKEGKYSGSGKLARYCIDRDEGKAVEHIMFSDEEVEEIRDVLLKNHADK